MNDWHVDSMVARARTAERLARAERSRGMRTEAGTRAPLRLHVRLELKVSFGRERAAAGPSVSTPAA